MMERRELSLVAKFDDICRGFSNFESCDQGMIALSRRFFVRFHSIILLCVEFLKFAKNQEECRQKWLAAENECVRLQAVLKDANQFSSQLEAKIRHISALLMHEVKIRHQLQLEHAQMVFKT
jgi:Rac GTPase-activating protein 1